MKRLFLLLFLILSYTPTAHAAIALDTTLGATSRQSSVTSITAAFNNVAGNYLIVAVADNTGLDRVSGVTYNGTAMTRLVANFISGSESHYVYGLASPATGSNNVVISFNATVVADYGAASYSGVNISAPTDGTFAGNSAGSSTITETITTTKDNDWIVAASGLQRLSSASTNSTRRSGNNTGGMGLFDTNGPIHPAGSFSMSQTLSTAGTFGGVAVALQPAAPASPSSIPGLVRSFWLF